MRLRQNLYIRNNFKPKLITYDFNNPKEEQTKYPKGKSRKRSTQNKD